MDDEVARIERIVRAAATPMPPGVRGPGDDCAVLPWAAGADLVVTTDAVSEGVQFWPESDPHDVGRLVAAVNLSDLAAAGAEPKGFLLAAAVPPATDASWLEAVAAGVGAMLRAHGVPLVGGDTKEAASRVLVGTAFGAVPHGEAVSRQGAQVGDVLAVTGPLGAVGARLRRLGKGEASLPEVSRAVLDVEPRVQQGILLRSSGAHAMVDLSDGLARGAALLAQRAQAQVVLDAETLPIADVARALLGPEASPEDPSWREVVLGTGGDYELLVALSPQAFGAARARFAQQGWPLFAVGEVAAGSGVLLRAGGRTDPLQEPGWRHFRTRAGAAPGP